MTVHLLILNYNGRTLMADCLPSILRAAQTSRYRCEVVVIDNDSTDDSVAWLAQHFPQVRVIRRPNRGLCSFNDVIADLSGPVALLLNNDIKLDPDSVDPLVAPLLDTPDCFMTAPLCWQADGHTYEGFKTAVRWRWGLVQATALYPGCERWAGQPGLTASAGAALAVDCRKFVELGGFDPLYLPGRLEDLDFAFRGYQAGYHGRYVPESVAYHLGMATFGRVFGEQGCQHLALRNTLLFQWKNLRHPRHLLRQMCSLPIRVAWDLCRGPSHWTFLRALGGALMRVHRLRRNPYRAARSIHREREFFQKFHPQQMSIKPRPSVAPCHNPSLENVT